MLQQVSGHMCLTGCSLLQPKPPCALLFTRRQEVVNTSSGANACCLWLNRRLMGWLMEPL